MNFVKSCCFTGPRIHKLGFTHGESDKKCDRLKHEIKQTVLRIIEQGCKEFISGMAYGIDLFCAEIILELKKSYPDIILHAAIPYENQTEHWKNKGDISRYHAALAKADKTTVLQKEYSRDCFYKRNRFMVDNSDLLVAVYNSSGGTKYTIDYAARKNVPTIIINP